MSRYVCRCVVSFVIDPSRGLGYEVVAPLGEVLFLASGGGVEECREGDLLEDSGLCVVR